MTPTAKKNVRLILLTITHLLVDMTTMCFLLHAVKPYCSTTTAITAVLLYDGLAFLLQPVWGFIFDKLNISAKALYASLLVICLLSAFNIDRWFTLAAMTVANGVFHVSASAVVFNDHDTKAAPLGIFVSMGAIGVALGQCFAITQIIGGMSILILAFLLFSFEASPEGLADFVNVERQQRDAGKIPLIPLVLICFAVFTRGFAGAGFAPDFALSTLVIILSAVSAAIGKASGGFIARLLGNKLTVAVLLSAAAVLLTFLPNVPIAYYIGIFAFNVSMPITLSLAAEYMRGYKLTAFGLLAMLLALGYMVASVLTINAYVALGATVLGAAAICAADFLAKPRNKQCSNAL